MTSCYQIARDLHEFQYNKVPLAVKLHFAVFEGCPENTWQRQKVLAFCLWCLRRVGFEVVEPFDGPPEMDYCRCNVSIDGDVHTVSVEPRKPDK